MITYKEPQTFNARGSQQASVPCSSQSLSSWSQRFMEVGLRSFCLAWIVSICRTVGQVLSPVSTEQDSDSCEDLCTCYPCSFKTVFSHAHRHRWSSSQGYSYLLTMIDRTTRWPEAVPLSSISTESCVRAFISTWVSRFRVPSTLTSDRGAQFKWHD